MPLLNLPSQGLKKVKYSTVHSHILNCLMNKISSRKVHQFGILFVQIFKPSCSKKILNDFTFIFLWLTLEFISSWGQLNAPLTQKFMTYFPLLVLCAVLFLCKNWLNVLLSRNLENCSLECRNVGIKLRTELITVLPTFRLTYKL